MSAFDKRETISAVSAAMSAELVVVIAIFVFAAICANAGVIGAAVTEWLQ